MQREVNHRKTGVSRLFKEFLSSEKSAGFVLIGCTVISMIIANSAAGENYVSFWHAELGADIGSLHLKHPIEYWINDGLMAIFFLLVGLEIEREIYVGQLSTLHNASLPVFAALGGMLAPAFIHFVLNRGTETQAGFGIPMATDIAFALGVLSLAGKRVPVGLKIFLTAFAIIDDLGAIIVIALFYTETFSALYFGIAMAIFALLIVFNRLRLHHLMLYLVPGVFMWYCMLQSGVHATISGVLLAFAIPFGNGDEKSVSYKLQHFLHKPVAFIILPLFALANTGIIFSSGWYNHLSSRNSLGVLAGLIVGKPLGIVLFSYTAVKLKISRLSNGLKWSHIIGAGILGGIGFTMSIFITLLAFADEAIMTNSKIAIVVSSAIAGVAGYVYLQLASKRKLHR